MRGQRRGPMAGKGCGRRGQGALGNKRRMLGFLQPCLLFQLSQGDKHGYELFQGLGKFMIDGQDYDPSRIYRILRDMEAQGVVTSYEGEASRGPKRRMYRLTSDGREQFASWLEDLVRSRNEIDRLLAACGMDVHPLPEKML